MRGNILNQKNNNNRNHPYKSPHSSGKNTSRRSGGFFVRLLILVIVVAVLAGAATAYMALSGVGLFAPDAPSSSPAATSSLMPASSLASSSALSAAIPATSDTATEPQPETPATTLAISGEWNVASRLQAPAAQFAPSSSMIALPENGRVDMSYFDTTVFVGDSLTDGLDLYEEGIPNAYYCAYVGISPKQIYDGSLQTGRRGVAEVPIDAIVAFQPDNVYILLGTNAMVGMDDTALLTYYNEMLDIMQQRLHPDVDIYIQSITPVLQGIDARFDITRIHNLNNQLARMAHEKGMYYIDLHEALAGDDTWLRSDFGASRDAYHLNPTGYSAWVEYLVTHTAYNRRHAHLYAEGPNYYLQEGLPE